MCGRSRCALDPERLKHAARTRAWPDQESYQPCHNVAPGRDTPVAFCAPDGTKELGMMTWGLVPSFSPPDAKVDHWKMFNARSESVAEKPAFRRLIPSRRCIVFLNGFYEWKREGSNGRKQPYYIYLENDEPMAMAGLYDVWRSEDGRKLKSYTILTTDSGKKLQWLHDRMPVILKTETQRELWMDTANPQSLEKLHSLYGPYDGDDLRWHPVCKEMSNPAFQGPRCAEELQKPAVADFFSPASKRKKGTLQSNTSSPLQNIKKEEDVQDVKKESDVQADQQLSPPKKRKIVPGQRNIDAFFSKNSA